MAISYSGRERTTEASTPVQSRVDLRTLAELALFFEECENVSVRSMSQLVSDSLEYFRSVLESNGALPERIDSLNKAVNVLGFRGLWKGDSKRGVRKLSMSLGFEKLRNNDVDPRQYAPDEYNRMHNPNSVKPSQYSDEGHSCRYDEELIEYARKDIESKKKYDDEQSRINSEISEVLKGKEVKKEVKDKGGKRIAIKMRIEKLENELMNGPDEDKEIVIIEELNKLREELNKTVAVTGIRE